MAMSTAKTGCSSHRSVYLITSYPGLTYFQDVHFHIQPTKLSRRRKFKVNNLPRNRNNLIQIPLNRKPNNESKTKLAYVPSFLLSNVMSLVPKSY